MKRTYLDAVMISAFLLAQSQVVSVAQFNDTDKVLLDHRAAEVGFQSIFNGKDLSGWDGNPKLWSVKDGAIMGQTTKENPASGNTFLIWTNGSPGDFELRCSFKIVPGDTNHFANSGIQYRSKILDAKNWVVGGYQADMEAGPTYTGILYEERMKRGIMAARGEKVVWDKNCKKQVVGSLGKSEYLQAMIKKEDWNDYVVIANGNHLQHFINGKQTVDVIDDCEAQRAMSGVLALQIHRGPPMMVQFRDLRIKTLSANSQSATDDLKNLQGAWQATRIEMNGSPPEESPKVLVTVKDTDYTLLHNEETDHGRFTIDPSQNPKQMDIRPEGGQDSDAMLAIYELGPDTLRVCYASQGTKRPTSFSSDDSGTTLISYKRKK